MTAESKTHLAADQAVRLLFADPDWQFKMGIGCLINGGAFALLLLNVILLPLCFCLWSLVAGYILMTTASKVVSPGNQLPVWTNFLELLIGGGIWIGASTLHSALFLLLAFLSLLIGELAGLDNLMSPAFLVWATAAWTIIVLGAATISLLSSYLLVNFATRQNLTAAFAVRQVFLRLRRQPRQMLEAWLIQLGLLYLATIIPILTVLGIFLIPSTVFFAQLIGCCLLSQAWREAASENELG
ncbi:MAG: hypothetical protein C5B53_04035 [Candidatus Melainabacteria bacterium]|nr:MAG: hypothetical protein C5B53_04035 [Candidatus Melainabacteria bacterium]